MRKFDYYYRLKLKANREAADVRFFGYMIKQALVKVIAMIVEDSLRIEKEFFFFQTLYPVSDGQLRQLGKEISFTEEEARRFVVQYGKSRQLFVRMKDKEIEKALEGLKGWQR